MLIFALRQAVSEIFDILQYVTLKGQKCLGSSILVLQMLLVPRGPKFCLFLLYDNRFLRYLTFCNMWPWKVKSDKGAPDCCYICFLDPEGPNFAYFCSTASVFWDIWHFAICDLERSKMSRVLRNGTTDAPYTQKAQILLIFALRQAVSEIFDIL